MTEDELLERITVDPAILGGKPIIRGMRLAVEHVLGMLVAGETPRALAPGIPLPGNGRHSSLHGVRAPITIR